MGDMADMIIESAIDPFDCADDFEWEDLPTCNKCGQAIDFKHIDGKNTPVDFDGEPHRCPIKKTTTIPLMSEVFQ